MAKFSNNQASKLLLNSQNFEAFWLQSREPRTYFSKFRCFSEAVRFILAILFEAFPPIPPVDDVGYRPRRFRPPKFQCSKESVRRPRRLWKVRSRIAVHMPAPSVLFAYLVPPFFSLQKGGVISLGGKGKWKRGWMLLAEIFWRAKKVKNG